MDIDIKEYRPRVTRHTVLPTVETKSQELFIRRPNKNSGDL